MTIRPSLLPPNSTLLEKALEQGTARVGEVPAPLKELWNPATCPLELLPWLAWALSCDRWESFWSEAEKREAVARSIELHRKKGTPASVEAVLASFDELLKLTEWFEMQPVGEAHTFTVDLPLVTDTGATGGDRVTAAFAEAIIRDVSRTKPVRSHWKLRQILEAGGELEVISAARVTGFKREDYAADTTVEPIWHTYLLTEAGEPITDELGVPLQYTAAAPYDGFALALDFVNDNYRRDALLFHSIADLPAYTADPLTVGLGALPADCLFYGKAQVPAALTENTLLVEFNVPTSDFAALYIWAGALELDYYVGASGFTQIIPITAGEQLAFVLQKVGDDLRLGYLDSGSLTWAGPAETSEALPPTTTINVGEGEAAWLDWAAPIAGLFVRPGTFTDAEILDILEAL